MASGAESPHVEEDEDDEHAGAGGGRQSGGPVGDAELLEEAHGAPVVERGLLQPGLAVEDRRDGAADEALVAGVEVFSAEAVRHDPRVDLVALVGVRGEHLAGDLRVTRFVGADEADLISAEDRDQAVEQKEAGDGDEDDELPEGATGIRGETVAPPPPEGRVFGECDGLGVFVQLRFLVRPRALT